MITKVGAGQQGFPGRGGGQDEVRAGHGLLDRTDRDRPGRSGRNFFRTTLVTTPYPDLFELHDLGQRGQRLPRDGAGAQQGQAPRAGPGQLRAATAAIAPVRIAVMSAESSTARTV